MRDDGKAQFHVICNITESVAFRLPIKLLEHFDVDLAKYSLYALKNQAAQLCSGYYQDPPDMAAVANIKGILMSNARLKNPPSPPAFIEGKMKRKFVKEHSSLKRCLCPELISFY